MAKKQTTKSRYWVSLIYPESAIPDWIDILTMSGLPIAISPLHDSDVFPDGTFKKPHYHILFCWDGPTTESVAAEVCNSIGAIHPKRCLSVKGSYEYWTHLNNPEKFQYRDEDRINLNGFDVNNYAVLSNIEELELIKYIKSIIRNNNITNLWTLSETLENEDLQAFQYLNCHTILFKSLVESKNKLARLKKVF